MLDYKLEHLLKVECGKMITGVHLAKQLLDYDPRIRLILTGSKADENLTSNIKLQIDSNRVLNLAGKFSLVGAAALIDSLDILITPDTGPLHIAER